MSDSLAALQTTIQSLYEAVGLMDDPKHNATMVKCLQALAGVQKDIMAAGGQGAQNGGAGANPAGAAPPGPPPGPPPEMAGPPPEMMPPPGAGGLPPELLAAMGGGGPPPMEPGMDPRAAILAQMGAQ